MATTGMTVTIVTVTIVLPLIAVLRRISVEADALLEMLGAPYRAEQARSKRLVPGVWEPTACRRALLGWPGGIAPRGHDDPTAADEAHLHTKKGAIWQTINEHPKLLFQIAGMTVGATPLLRVGDLGPRRT